MDSAYTHTIAQPSELDSRERQRDRETEGQRDKETERESDRETER